MRILVFYGLPGKETIPLQGLNQYLIKTKLLPAIGDTFIKYDLPEEDQRAITKIRGFNPRAKFLRVVHRSIHIQLNLVNIYLHDLEAEARMLRGNVSIPDIFRS